MSDIDVYCFFGWDHSADRNVRASRPARLDVIRDKGKPVIDTLRIVDESELDENGFLKSEYCTEGLPRVEALKILAASLQRRAAARELHANTPNDNLNDERITVFRIQSAGLRAEAAGWHQEALRLEAEGNAASHRLTPELHSSSSVPEFDVEPG